MRSGVPAVVCLLLLTAVPARAQTAAGEFARGDSLYDANAFQAAGLAYEAAAALDTTQAVILYNAGCSWSRAGEAEKAMEALRRAAARGYSDRKFMARDTDLEPLHDAPGWQDLLAAVQANQDAAEKDFDKPLQERLERIYVRDQTLRHLVEPAEKLFGRDSDEMQHLWHLMAREDSVDLAEVTDIIRTRGWVGRSLVGAKANTALWLVIQHAPLEAQQEFLPLLQQSVADEESSGSDLALLQDRILMRTGQPQKYGSQIATDPETGERRLYLLEDPYGVDARRAAVGLGPIADYVANWDLIWDPDEMAARLRQLPPADPK